MRPDKVVCRAEHRHKIRDKYAVVRHCRCDWHDGGPEAKEDNDDKENEADGIDCKAQYARNVEGTPAQWTGLR